LYYQLRPESGRDEDGIGARGDGIGGEEGVPKRACGGCGAVSEDLVLGTFGESVGVVVDWSTLGIGGIEHVVTLVVGPVHGVQRLRTSLGDVPPLGVEVAGWFSIAPNGGGRGGDGEGGGVLDVALERGHVHLVSTSNGIVDPEPGAYTLAVRACREGGDVEGLELARNAVVDGGDDYEVSGSDVGYVGLVGDSEGTSGY
jgi:hypothetical protein